MMNKNERMEALKNAGIPTDNFFDLSLRIPFGAEVKLVVDGKEMIVGQNNGFVPNVNCDEKCEDVSSINGIPINTFGCPAIGKSTLVSDDPIVKDILDNGYVFNSRTDGRFVTAQTFRMLNERSWNWKTRKYEYGWDAYLRNRYAYMYQFGMMLDEVHKLTKMERNNDPEFDRLSSFFTKAVVYETCKHYIRQLKKFINSQPKRKCKGVPYVKLNKYGNVFIKDLDSKVYLKLRTALNDINDSSNYAMLEKHLRAFMNSMIKLPYDTPKCSQWKDAFKGKGAYLTLLNIIKFHGVIVQNYETKVILDRDRSVAYVESLLDTYKNQYWKFHELLKATIELNNFDLNKSIESQK